MPVIKNMTANYGNKTIKLDKKFYQKLNDNRIMNYSELDIADSKVTQINSNYHSNLNQSEIMLRTDSRNENTKKIDYKQFKLNLMTKVRRGSQKRRDSSNQNRSSNSRIILNSKQNNAKRPFSLTKSKRVIPNKIISKSNSLKTGPSGVAHRLMISKTIEHRDKAMIEEYTNASIPEFTLGPDNFEPRELPLKPHSVNRMGFYEECKDVSVPISPIKPKIDTCKFGN